MMQGALSNAVNYGRQEILTFMFHMENYQKGKDPEQALVPDYGSEEIMSSDFNLGAYVNHTDS